MSPTAPVILHLTDLHFGWGGNDANAQNQRAVSQQALLATLAQLPLEWKPSIICLSGDIGWHGARPDYEAARLWLDKLLAHCELTYEQVIVAAGNHDIIREVADYVTPPRTSEEADRSLRIPIGEAYKQAFAEFTRFCEQANIPAMHIHGQDSWLVGERMLGEVRFVVVNSAWFCREGNDRGNLWVGRPQLLDLESHGQLGRIDDPATPLTVALVHHPADWWHENERHIYNSERPGSWNLLTKRSHLILTGHTHARLVRPDGIAQAAYHFPGAAAYAGPTHWNGFRLIRLEAEQFAYRSYAYDAGADLPVWQMADESSVPRQLVAGQQAVPSGTQKKKRMP